MLYTRTTAEKACPKCKAIFSVERKVDVYGNVSPLKDEREYCSRSCANSKTQTPEMNRKRREKLAGRIKGTMLKRNAIECYVCQKTFMPKNKNQKYCSIECANKKQIATKRVVGNYPFDKYYVYGPFLTQPLGRYTVQLIPIGNTGKKGSIKRKWIAYSRYLMSVQLGRILESNETVDHINGNKIDDRIDNLQLLSFADNSRKAVVEQNRTLKMVELQCPYCEKIFVRAHHHTFLSAKNSNKTFCSRSCSTKFQHSGKTFDKANVIRIFRK